MKTLNCPYCKDIATLRSSKEVYGGRDFGNMFICNNYPSCDAYVGVHLGSNKPLGRLANAELRSWKKRAHAHFDPLWQKKLSNRRAGKLGKSGRPGGLGYKKSYARSSGYKWLAAQLGIEKKIATLEWENKYVSKSR